LSFSNDNKILSVYSKKGKIHLFEINQKKSLNTWLKSFIEDEKSFYKIRGNFYDDLIVLPISMNNFLILDYNGNSFQTTNNMTNFIKFQFKNIKIDNNFNNLSENDLFYFNDQIIENKNENQIVNNEKNIKLNYNTYQKLIKEIDCEKSIIISLNGNDYKNFILKYFNSSNIEDDNKELNIENKKLNIENNELNIENNELNINSKQLNTVKYFNIFFENKSFTFLNFHNDFLKLSLVLSEILIYSIYDDENFENFLNNLLLLLKNIESINQKYFILIIFNKNYQNNFISTGNFLNKYTNFQILKNIFKGKILYNK
jgi:hypothetical protein